MKPCKCREPWSQLRIPHVLSAQKRFDLPQGTKGWEIRDKGRRQRMRMKRKGTRERDKGDKGLPLGREETVVVHRQMAVYKGKKGKPVLARGA